MGLAIRLSPADKGGTRLEDKVRSVAILSVRYNDTTRRCEEDDGYSRLTSLR
jgi:hypothetical protein